MCIRRDRDVLHAPSRIFVMETLLIPNMQVKEAPILAHSIAESLEAEIIYGRISGNTRLTEEIVCKMTGASRSPVREALRLLEKSGLAVREPRRSVRVSELTIEELDQLYICRIALETTAAKLAVKNATDFEIDAILQAHVTCEERLKNADIRGHFQANVEMSHRVFEAAHNKPLLRLLGTIHKQALRYRYFAYENSQLVREQSVANNALLISRFSKRDGPGAAFRTRKSIEKSYVAIRKCLVDNTNSDQDL